MSVSKFKKLHQQDSPLILGNVWDGHTAQLAEKAGFKALGSSSHAIANLLGYPDGQKISFKELAFMVKRIVQATTLPVSVDFEAGYASDPKKVVDYAQQLEDLGVVGINIEDGIVKKGVRTLPPAKDLAKKIKAIRKKTNLFINARADTFTTKHENALEEAIERARMYADAGADGIFIPLIEKAADIRQLTEAIPLPLNVFLTPQLSRQKNLANWGVKRISLGGTIYDWLVPQLETAFGNYLDAQQLPK